MPPPKGPTRKLWTDEELDFLREHYGKLPASEIAVKLGRTERAVRINASKLKVTANEVGCPKTGCQKCGTAMVVTPGGWKYCPQCKNQRAKEYRERLKNRNVCTRCRSEKYQDKHGHWRCKQCQLEDQRRYSAKRRGETAQRLPAGDAPTYVPKKIWGPGSATAAIQATWDDRERYRRAGIPYTEYEIPQHDSGCIVPGGFDDRDVFNF
jgi:hypothetical protein